MRRPLHRYWQGPGLQFGQILVRAVVNSASRLLPQRWSGLANACGAAKVPGLLFHDLRRTAARNLRRAGVAEGVIMKIGGWKTRSVFERYAIVSQSDIRDAMAKLEAGQQRDNAEAAKDKRTAEEQFGQSLGRNAPKTTERDNAPALSTPPIN